MNKYFLISLGILSLIPFMTSEGIYPGGCYNLVFPNNENITMEIISNQTSLEGFTWSKNDSIITYCLSADFPPQEFRVRWFNNGYENIVVREEVIREVRVGGGGGGTRTITKTVNQTVEVPTYVDREVIREIEKPIEVIKEIPSVEEKNNYLWIILVFLLTFFSIVLAVKLIKEKRDYIKIDERRLDEYGTEEIQ